MSACAGSADAGSSTPVPAAVSPPASVPSSVPAAGSTGATAPTTPATPTPSSAASVTAGASGASDQQTEKDESSAGSEVVARFLEAIEAQDFTAAGGLLAPDATFQLEEVTNRVRRITLRTSSMSLAPDGEGQPHLALKGTGNADVTARSGSDLQSGQYRLAVSLRRESRRDEWLVWSFELQPQ